MVTIEGKAVLFETTILLRPNETALITTPDTHPIRFKLIVGASGTMPTDVNELKAEMSAGEAIMKLPFLPANFTFSSDHFVQFQGKNVDVYLAAHGRGEFMVTHLQCRGTRS